MKQGVGGVFAVMLLLGCASESCPPGFPVMRDGMCYAADDSGSGGLDAAAALDGAAADGAAGRDGAAGGDDGGATDGAVAMDAGPPADAGCMAAHPLFDGMGNRWCDPGCYCSTGDACYAAEVAEACCPVATVCGPPDGGVAPPDAGCMGTHPLVRDTPPQRYCAPGHCYCGDLSRSPPLDVCYPAANADACCPVTTVCY